MNKVLDEMVEASRYAMPDDPRLGIPTAQWSKRSTPESRERFVRAYNRAGSHEAQDQLHEDGFVGGRQ